MCSRTTMLLLSRNAYIYPAISFNRNTILMVNNTFPTTSVATFITSSEDDLVKEAQRKRIKAEKQYRLARSAQKGYMNEIADLRNQLDDLEAQEPPKTAEELKSFQQQVTLIGTKLNSAEASLAKAQLREENSFEHFSTLVLKEMDDESQYINNRSKFRNVIWPLVGFGLGLFGSVCITMINRKNGTEHLKKVLEDSTIVDIQQAISNSITGTVEESMKDLVNCNLMDSQKIASNLEQIKIIAKSIDESVERVNQKSRELDVEMGKVKRASDQMCSEINLKRTDNKDDIVKKIAEFKQELIDHIDTVLADKVSQDKQAAQMSYVARKQTEGSTVVEQQRSSHALELTRDEMTQPPAIPVTISQVTVEGDSKSVVEVNQDRSTEISQDRPTEVDQDKPTKVSQDNPTEVSHDNPTEVSHDKPTEVCDVVNNRAIILNESEEKVEAKEAIITEKSEAKIPQTLKSALLFAVIGSFFYYVIQD